MIPRCSRSLAKLFCPYLFLSRVGPVSFKYLFSIKTESQTISWKNIDFYVPLSFISLPLKLHFRKVAQSVSPELQLEIRSGKDAISRLEEGGKERRLLQKAFRENYIYFELLIILFVVDLFCSGMSNLQSLKIKCFLFISIFVTLVSISLLPLTFLLFGYPIAASFLCWHLEKNCFPISSEWGS